MVDVTPVKLMVLPSTAIQLAELELIIAPYTEINENVRNLADCQKQRIENLGCFSLCVDVCI